MCAVFVSVFVSVRLSTDQMYVCICVCAREVPPLSLSVFMCVCSLTGCGCVIPQSSCNLCALGSYQPKSGQVCVRAYSRYVLKCRLCACVAFTLCLHF